MAHSYWSYLYLWFYCNDEMMEKHEKFSEWAVAGGVTINGIAAHRFPGKGLGVIATKNHEVGGIGSLAYCYFHFIIVLRTIK